MSSLPILTLVMTLLVTQVWYWKTHTILLNKPLHSFSPPILTSQILTGIVSTTPNTYCNKCSSKKTYNPSLISSISTLTKWLHLSSIILKPSNSFLSSCISSSISYLSFLLNAGCLKKLSEIPKKVNLWSQCFHHG